MICPGKEREKALVFYALVNEGGVEAHERISATDKDFPPVFKKMVALATYELYEIA